LTALAQDGFLLPLVARRLEIDAADSSGRPDFGSDFHFSPSAIVSDHLKIGRQDGFPPPVLAASRKSVAGETLLDGVAVKA